MTGVSHIRLFERSANHRSFDQRGLPELTITGSLPDTEVGVAYEERLQINNSVGDCFSWLESGDLPAGYTISTDNTTKEIIVAWPAYTEGAAPIQNDSFDDGSDGWIVGAGWTLGPSSGAETGGTAAEYLRSGYSYIEQSAFTPCAPGDSITARARINPGQTGNGSEGYLYILWFDEDKNFLAANFTIGVFEDFYEWDTVTGTAPANAAFVKLRVLGYHRKARSPLYCDRVEWNHTVASGVGTSVSAVYLITLATRDSLGRIAYWTGAVSVGDALWTPMDAAVAPYAWFVSDSELNTTDVDGNYTEWHDLTGNEHHGQAQKTTGTPLVAYGLWSNGRSVAQISPGNQASTFLLDDSLGYLRDKAGATVAAVYNVAADASESERGILMCLTGVGNERLAISSHYAAAGGSNKPWITGRMLDADSLQSLNGATARSGEQFVIAAVDYANSNASIYTANGLEASTASWSTDGSTSDTDSSPNGVRLGKWRNGGTGQAGLGGQLAEVVMWDSTISSDDRQKLEGYLAWKWDLVSQLPADHPYKSAPPTV